MSLYYTLNKNPNSLPWPASYPNIQIPWASSSLISGLSDTPWAVVSLTCLLFLRHIKHVSALSYLNMLSFFIRFCLLSSFQNFYSFVKSWVKTHRLRGHFFSNPRSSSSLVILCPWTQSTYVLLIPVFPHLFVYELAFKSNMYYVLTCSFVCYIFIRDTWSTSKFHKIYNFMFKLFQVCLKVSQWLKHQFLYLNLDLFELNYDENSFSQSY